MSSSALYHTTAALLGSAHIGRHLAWLVAALALLAIVIAPQPWLSYAAILLTVLLLASAYLHGRLVLDQRLLTLLADDKLQPDELSEALHGLRLRRNLPPYSPQQRSIACLALCYKAMMIDSVLFLLGSASLYYIII